MRQERDPSNENIGGSRQKALELLGNLATRTLKLGGEEVEVPTLITTLEAAKLLRVSRRTVTNWVSEDQIPHLRLPKGDVRIPLGELVDKLSESDN